MSYCVNCGVELAEYIKVCPLCSTEVLNPKKPHDPDSTPPYPNESIVSKHISLKLILGVLALIFLLPVVICVFADISTDRTMEWSSYVIASLLALYTIIATTLTVHKESLVLEQIFDYMAAILLLVYIENQCDGDWFLKVSLPIISGIAIATLSITFIYKLSAKRPLTIIAASLYFSGLICVICEVVFDYYLCNRLDINWSIYPFISVVIIGSVILFIDNNKYIKRRLEKKFFI